MKTLSIYSFLVIILIAEAALGQTDETDEYPVATPTDQPNIVISPYNSKRQLDVEGLKPGSLAEDPVANKIFRIPYSNPAQRYYENYPDSQPSEPVPPPPINSNSNEVVPPPPIDPAPRDSPVPTTPAGPNSPSWAPVSNEIPTDLLNFIYAFNQNSSVNDADALLPFYAERVESYFGKKNLSRSAIRADRANYIKRFPQREYVLDGAPVLLSQKGNIYEVMTRVRYQVSGGGRNRSGAVSDYFKIARGPQFFQIVSIDEAKASPAPATIQQQDLQRLETQSPVTKDIRDGAGTVYSRFQAEQLSLFLDAFAASGEVNDPSAMAEFMHSNVSHYYGKNNPSHNDILRDRRNFINRWPERRYWLTEEPLISSAGNGSWDVVTKTGYEVKNGPSDIKRGTAVSELRIVQTASGLKVLSVRSR